MFKCACEGVSRRAASVRQRRVYRRRVLLWQEARLLRRKVSTKFFFYFQKLSLVHSDENACSVTEDPNRADVSGFTNLLFETTEPISGVRPCWVPSSRLLLFSRWDSGSRDRRRQTGGGKKILGPTSMWPSQGLTQVTNLPMMITFTFNGAVNDENVRVYDRLFHGGPFTNNFISVRNWDAQ